ncbi:putative farnesyl-diphosphate synthetase [Kalaharituber pfeilii]|nr:putative farnesyl-diphosphate synthetase [Kalaharituber pfeilii]
MTTTLNEFEPVFTKLIVPALIEHVSQYKIPDNVLEWYRKNLLHNTVGGKCNRGMTVVDTYKVLQEKDKLTEDEYNRAAILGWCTELLQAFFLVLDDIMDSSKTRRNFPCWYLMDGVGMIAINDGVMLENSIYILLKKYFRSEKYYVDLMELFHEVTLQTEIGQTLDLLTAPEDKVNLENFSLEKYRAIVIYKTAYYSFYLPVALALYMAGLASPANLKAAHDVLIPLGEYFQIQDDYLDCYGDPVHIGKIGTDIKDNKCSWLVNKALQLVTPEQRQILEENYGRKDDDCERRIKQLYADLNLEQLYKEYEAEAVKGIRARIAEVDESGGLKRNVLETFLKKIEGRSR